MTVVNNKDQYSPHKPLPSFIDDLPPGPFFDLERSGNVTALVGRPAKLNCRVNKIGNRTVSAGFSWFAHHCIMQMIQVEMIYSKL